MPLLFLKGKRYLFFAFGLLLLLAGAVGAAENTPAPPPPPAALPAAYEGAVRTASGEPVSGGLVRAFVAEEPCGEAPFAGGRYGDPENPDIPKLLVYSALGGDLSGKPVVFKVVTENKIYTAWTDPSEVLWQSGDIKTVDLITDPASGVEAPAAGAPAAPVYPVAAPASGGYTGSVTVTLTAFTPGSLIYYTTDGSDPKDGPGRKEYTAPLTFDRGTTLKAVAEKNGARSEVSTYTYAVSPDATSMPETAPGGSPDAQPVLSDISGHWAESSVVQLVYLGVVKGYEDNTFRPENEISRLEAVAVLARALKTAGEAEDGLAAFSDAAAVPAWGRRILAAAVKEGLIKGYPLDGGKMALNPDGPVSRAEMAALSGRLIVKLQGPRQAPRQAPRVDFADRDLIPEWAADEIALTVAAGIVKGYPDNTFGPDKNVTRAECAVMAGRLLAAGGP